MLVIFHTVVLFGKHDFLKYFLRQKCSFYKMVSYLQVFTNLKLALFALSTYVNSVKRIVLILHRPQLIKNLLYLRANLQVGLDPQAYLLDPSTLENYTLIFNDKIFVLFKQIT